MYPSCFDAGKGEQETPNFRRGVTGVFQWGQRAAKLLQQSLFTQEGKLYDMQFRVQVSR